MRLVRIVIEPRSAALVGTASERRALLVRVLDESGETGLGEATPLPGYSRDPFETCRQALDAAAARPLDDAVAETAEALAPLAGRLLPDAPVAARAALEMALLDLQGRLEHRPVWSILRALASSIAPVPTLMPLAALLDAPDRDSLLKGADQALGRGVSTLKIKIGRHGTFARELERLHALRDHVGRAVRLRFDANGAWSAEQAKEFLADLAALHPEYVEEPVAGGDLAALGASPVPLALDESLAGIDLGRLEPWLEPCRVMALVVKPGLFGMFGALSVARWAARRRLHIVASHLFDGSVAFAAAAQLALAVGSEERAVGLDRHVGLELFPELEVPYVSPAYIRRCDAPGLGIERRALDAA